MALRTAAGRCQRDAALQTAAWRTLRPAPLETDHNFACSPYPLAMPDIWRMSGGMLVIALISLAVSSAQDGAVPYGTQVYAPPVVRPYEPPSNFGRIVAEGDGGGDVTRPPII